MYEWSSLRKKELSITFMKKERNIFMKKQSIHLKNLKDSILNWIEKTSGRIHNWAWDKRWKERNSEQWIREYKEWKKN